MQRFRLLPARPILSFGPKQPSFYCTCCGKCKRACYRKYATASEQVCDQCGLDYVPAEISAAISQPATK